jgi:nucleotide-binding universal stress UspA family protein
MTRVLAFGDDHSPGAEVCWQWICDQVWTGWALEVVTAVPPPDMRPVDPELAELHEWAPDQPRDPDPAGFVSVVHLTAAVDPRVALISKPWDLVAVGPKGGGFLKRMSIGSTADWLLRDPVSPLVIARHPGRVREVLVAADGSDAVASAVGTLAMMPLVEGARVRVVSVDDGATDTEKAHKDVTDALSGSGAELETEVVEGEATRALVTTIEETTPDLVVLGARGTGGFKRLVLGSTTAAIASATDRTILVAHAPS